VPPIIPVDTTNIVVIIALPEEHDVFLEAFPSTGDVSDETHVRLRHKFDLDGFTLTSVLAEGMGADYAASAAQSGVRDLRPDLLVCLGIAGSLSADALLGDVCIGTEIIDVLHNMKIIDELR
jgi:nucleoside phosphorylase